MRTSRQELVHSIDGSTFRPRHVGLRLRDRYGTLLTVVEYGVFLEEFIDFGLAIHREGALRALVYHVDSEERADLFPRRDFVSDREVTLDLRDLVLVSPSDHEVVDFRNKNRWQVEEARIWRVSRVAFEEQNTSKMRLVDSTLDASSAHQNPPSGLLSDRSVSYTHLTLPTILLV